MPTGVYVRTAEHNRKNSESTKGLKRSEEAKANMKGHSGVYIRTALNLKNLKVAQNRPEMKKIKSINTKKQWQDSLKTQRQGRKRAIIQKHNGQTQTVYLTL